MGVSDLMETMKRTGLAATVGNTLRSLLAAVLLFAIPSHAYVRITGNTEFPELTGEPIEVSWNLDAKPSGIPFLVRTDSMGEGTLDIAGNAEIEIIKQGFQTWEDVASARISYQYMGTTDALNPGALDNVCVVGFASNNLMTRAGVLAVTLPTFRSGADDPARAGEMVEADIVLYDSARIQWTEQGRNDIPAFLGSAATLNLEEVITREIGHFNGLHASFVRAPFNKPPLSVENGIIYQDNRKGPFTETCLMYPYALQGSPVREAATPGSLLSTDEIAAISTLYPVPEQTANFGSIAGQVTVHDTETLSSEPLGGAHVVAVAPGAYRPVAGTLSNEDGTYALQGLPAGEYLIWVEPTSTGDYDALSPAITDAAMDFLPEFYNNTYYENRDAASSVSVAAGGTTPDIDVEVIKTIPNREVTYAFGGKTDSEGNRVILKIEPDDTQERATELWDENGDDFLSINDVIQETADVDFYSFGAVRDDVWRIKVIGSDIGSSLVSYLRIFGPGVQLTPVAESDGSTVDAVVTFTVPATGRYFVEVTDAFGRGGALYFYTLTLERVSGRVPLSPLNPPVAVLSVPISDQDLIAAGLTGPTFGNVVLKELRVRFLDVDGDGGLNTDGSDFLPPTREVLAGLGGVESGFALFEDVGPVPGQFDLDPANPDQTVQDRSIRMREAPFIQQFAFGFEITFIPESPLRIPAQSRQDDIADFHVVVQTSETFHHGDDFQVIIPQDGIVLDVNGAAGVVQTTRFAEAFPPALERNKYTGDVINLTSFIPDGAATIKGRSPDYAICGINLIGDPAEQYWVSEIEVTFVGYNLTNVIPFVDLFWSWPLPLPSTEWRTWEMTDLMPFTGGDDLSGGINVYFDNDAPGSDGVGIPNFGLDGDLLLPFAGNQRFEVIDPATIPDEIIADLWPPRFGGQFPNTVWLGPPPAPSGYFDLNDFLAHRDELNLYAFKAILPLEPSAALAFPPDDEGAHFGPDMFVTIRTSNTVQALDMFIPFLEVDSVTVSSDLPDVLANGGDLSFSSLVNGTSLRSLDPTTKPNMSVIEVRPDPEFAFKDMVNYSDNQNQGAIIGSASEGSPPIAVLGIDGYDFYADAMRTPNLSGFGASALLNTGTVLDSLTVFVDPVNRPVTIPEDFLLPIIAPSVLDPDLVGTARNGMAVFLDDTTPQGDYLDNDFDGLYDEELVNQSDDDLDGISDEEDFGDEDAVGTLGKYDLADDIIAYLQRNDVLAAHGTTQLALEPVITPINNSLRVDFPDLTSFVFCEWHGDSTFLVDPYSVWGDSVFVRVDHTVLTRSELIETGCVGPSPAPAAAYQNGFVADGGDDLEWLTADGTSGFGYNYYYATEVPNSNAIPEFVGPDFFVVVRAGLGAISGDLFRLRIPANGLRFSSYRGPSTASRGIRPGEAPALDVGSTEVRIGAQNVPPLLTFVEPAAGKQEAEGIEVDGRLCGGGIAFAR